MLGVLDRDEPVNVTEDVYKLLRVEELSMPSMGPHPTAVRCESPSWYVEIGFETMLSNALTVCWKAIPVEP